VYKPKYCDQLQGDWDLLKWQHEGCCSTLLLLLSCLCRRMLAPCGC
jgi:hypothetical protein